MHFFTGKPISGIPVRLNFDDATSAKNSQEGVFSYGTINSDINGNFHFQGRKSRRNSYYLHLNNEPALMEFEIDGKTKELGNVKFGSHTFTCNLHIVGLSTDKIVLFNFPSAAINTSLSAGTDTLIQGTFTATSESHFKSVKNSFPINLKIGSVNSSTFFPITNTDNINATLNY